MSASQRRPTVSGLQSLSAGATTRWARSGVSGFEVHPDAAPASASYEYFVFRGVTTTIVFSLIAGAVVATEAFLVVRGARGIGVVVAGIFALGA